jgi:AcrR family transcriptional regulator
MRAHFAPCNAKRPENGAERMAPKVGEYRVDQYATDGSRAAILEAAARCFTERGYDATSIDDVARSLGATKGRIYHHYPSKADLFADVFRAGMEMNYAAIEPVRDLPGKALGRWRTLAFTHVVQMIRRRTFQRVVWEGTEMYLRGATTPQQRSTFAALHESRSRYGAIFRQTIAEAKKDGDMRFGSLGIANQLMLVTLSSPIFWYSPRPGETRDDIDDIAWQVVAFAASGLGASEGEFR